MIPNVVEPEETEMSKKARTHTVRSVRHKPKQVKKRQRRTVTIPCVSWKQAGIPLVMFAMDAKKLWNIVEVNRRVEDKDEGYQRALSAARVARIRDFIDQGNVLPTSVLVSFDDGKLKSNGSILEVPNDPRAGWIIDGQHRLAGAHEAERDIVVPVVAFIRMSLDEQINCFVTVNREQKGVPSSLYYDLLKYLPNTKTEKEVVQQRAADLAAALKTDEMSPFYGRIVSTSAPKRGRQLSLTNFVRKLSPHLRRNGRLFLYSDEERKGIINNYYRAIASVFPKEYQKRESIYFKTLGFGALMGSLPMVLDITLQHEGGFTVEDVSVTLRQIDFFDFSVWSQKGTGTAAENAAANELMTELSRVMNASDSPTIRL